MIGLGNKFAKNNEIIVEEVSNEGISLTIIDFVETFLVNSFLNEWFIEVYMQDILHLLLSISTKCYKLYDLVYHII